jgi:hypothetical protein
MTDPELELNPVQRSNLAMTYHSKGWAVVDLLFKIVVEEARLDLDNANHSDPKDVMAKHALSRATGTVVTKIIQRIANEVAFAQDARHKNGEPQESAPGIEMDDLAAATDGLPNLLGDVNYIAEEDDLEEGR